MTRRATLLALIGVSLLVPLSGCSPAIQFGARLNVDGTVDYITCNDWGSPFIYMDFRLGREDGPVEWQADGPVDTDLNGVVVHYGENPEGFTGASASPPPAEWDLLQFGFSNISRDELKAGKWVWSTADFSFVPDRPCVEIPDGQ